MNEWSYLSKPVVDELRAVVTKSGLSIRSWARCHGFHAATISHILNGQTRPTPKVCEFLGWQKSNKMYRKVKDGQQNQQARCQLGSQDRR